ncbi:hypothetical protein Bbelb_160400, partial [Branchiostoma belcheri]
NVLVLTVPNVTPHVDIVTEVRPVTDSPGHVRPEGFTCVLPGTTEPGVIKTLCLSTSPTSAQSWNTGNPYGIPDSLTPSATKLRKYNVGPCGSSWEPASRRTLRHARNLSVPVHTALTVTQHVDIVTGTRPVTGSPELVRPEGLMCARPGTLVANVIKAARPVSLDLTVPAPVTVPAEIPCVTSGLESALVEVVRLGGMGATVRQESALVEGVRLGGRGTTVRQRACQVSLGPTVPAHVTVRADILCVTSGLESALVEGVRLDGREATVRQPAYQVSLGQTVPVPVTVRAEILCVTSGLESALVEGVRLGGRETTVRQ